MKTLTIAALVLLGAASTAQAAGDAAVGKTKVAICSSCHGMDGNGNPANPLWPKLAGQHPSYIEKQLGEFKSGTRKDPTMNGMTAALSEADMADIAAYFSGQQRSVDTTAGGEAQALALGEKIFRGGIPEKGVSACMACHGPDGAGNPLAKYPAIASQHSAYAVKTLKDFRSTTRSNDPAKMMQMVVNRMSDAEIDAVASYLASLH